MNNRLKVPTRLLSRTSPQPVTHSEHLEHFRKHFAHVNGHRKADTIHRAIAILSNPKKPFPRTHSGSIADPLLSRSIHDPIFSRDGAAHPTLTTCQEFYWLTMNDSSRCSTPEARGVDFPKWISNCDRRNCKDLKTILRVQVHRICNHHLRHKPAPPQVGHGRELAIIIRPHVDVAPAGVGS